MQDECYLVKTQDGTATQGPMKNYVKAAGVFFFFDDAKLAETQRAYAAALCCTVSLDEVAFFQPPADEGPWDRACIIGHRRRVAILTDIVGEQDANELDWRRQELERLDQAYIDAGRDKTPVELVAA